MLSYNDWLLLNGLDNSPEAWVSYMKDMGTVMIQTEMKFVRVLGEIDELQEELFDLGGEENSIADDCWYNGSCYNDDGSMTEEAQVRLEEIDTECGVIDTKLEQIRSDIGLNERQFDIMRDSCITNRWEVYAHMMGAEIVSLKDIASGKV